ncbi:MAG TPA: DUF5655 domain-containing protein [Acidobacteriota bacterium]|nr:DUF5655 domain-containing protein [Acidobacteriota bacterium]
MHSCETYPVDAHFKNSEPYVRKLYKSLVSQVEKFGAVTVNSVKTCIQLQRRGQFCSIHPRKRHLLVELLGDRNLTDPIVLKVTQPSPDRFVYTLHIARPEDLNQKVLSWLKRAYQLAD